MSQTLMPLLNVSHIAGPDGKCSRCKSYIGCFMQVEDQDAKIPFLERQWNVGERVIEYECPDGRNRFADQVAGYAIECQP